MPKKVDKKQLRADALERLKVVLCGLGEERCMSFEELEEEADLFRLFRTQITTIDSQRNFFKEAIDDLHRPSWIEVLRGEYHVTDFFFPVSEACLELHKAHKRPFMFRTDDIFACRPRSNNKTVGVQHIKASSRYVCEWLEIFDRFRKNLISGLEKGRAGYWFMSQEKSDQVSFIWAERQLDSNRGLKTFRDIQEERDAYGEEGDVEDV